jgi:hypothetical protein
VRWTKRLKQLFSGANSRTEERTEQSEWSRTSLRSVEVTIESAEVVVQERHIEPPSEQAMELEDPALEHPREP